MIGELGVLCSDGDKVQCHLCGRWYGHLGAHVSRTHKQPIDEYKENFGLNRTTGLIGETLAAIRKLQMSRAFIEGAKLSKQQLLSLSSEERSNINKGKTLRQQSRLECDASGVRHFASDKAVQTKRKQVDADSHWVF